MTALAKPKYKNRQAYLDAALELISVDGVAKLSMRKVATQLGVSPMAVYKHFANKDELVAAALDEFIARSDVFPPQELPWDQWILYMARGMYEALIGEVSWVPALGEVRSGKQAARVTRMFVTKMTQAGFSARDAVYAYSAMTQLVVGSVSNRSTIEKEAVGDQQVQGNYMQQLMASDERVNSEVADEFRKLAVLPQIEIGMPLLIEALRARLENCK